MWIVYHSRMLLFVLLGGAFGYALAGLFGLLLGALAGYVAATVLLQVLLPIGQGGLQSQFLDTTFAVMGALCKADGRVSREEIQVVEQYFDKLALSPEQRQAARDSFNRGKAEGFDLYSEVSALRRVLRYNHAQLQLFLQIQLSAIAADGRVHDNEHRMMLHIARALGLVESDVERLEAMLRQASIGPSEPSSHVHEDTYAILGVEPSASDAEVKKAYRRLMSRYHPDKFASSGLPENMRTVAEERVREIRRAYDAIQQQRSR